MKIASVVLNNFTNDNRVYKVAESLTEQGHEVTVVALLKGDVPERETYLGIPVHRIRLKSLSLPDKNKFYSALKFLEFFLKVIWNYRRYDVIHGNDFEGFMAGVMVKLTRPSVKLVYDSHEYQKEKYGVQPFMKRVIGLFERMFIGWARIFITVSKPIGEEYKRLYGISKAWIVMNAPHLEHSQPGGDALRNALKLSASEKIFLYQGGFARSRGIEVLLESFSRPELRGYHMVFMGSGPLKELIESYSVKSPNIHLLPPVKYMDLIAWTSGADVGLVSTQNLCLNNYMCLPNKLFEYIHAEVPVLTNNLVECASIVQENNLGAVIGEYTPEGVIKAVQEILAKDIATVKSNLRQAKTKFNWEEQEKVLLEAYSGLMK